MTERERLVELLEQKSCAFAPCDNECNGCHNVEMYDDQIEAIADHLLANGVIVPLFKPIAVMTDGTEFNTDVYCPYCGTNLSGLYGEEPPNIISCYVCGEYLDDTKSITKAEAEKALAERSKT